MLARTRMYSLHARTLIASLIVLVLSAVFLFMGEGSAWAAEFDIKTTSSDQNVYNNKKIQPDWRKITEENAVITIYDKANFAVRDYTGGGVSCLTDEEGKRVSKIVVYKGSENHVSTGEHSDGLSHTNSLVIGNRHANGDVLFSVRYPDAAYEYGTSKAIGDVLIEFYAVSFAPCGKTDLVNSFGGSTARAVFQPYHAWLCNGFGYTGTSPGDMNAYNNIHLGTILHLKIKLVESGSDTMLDVPYNVHVYDIDQPARISGNYTDAMWQEGFRFFKGSTAPSGDVYMQTNSLLEIVDADGNPRFMSTESDDKSFASGIIAEVEGGAVGGVWYSGTTCATQLGIGLPSSIDNPDRPPSTNPVKEVDKSKATIGDVLTYTVTQKVNNQANRHYSKFVFSDKLQDEIEFVDGSVNVIDGGKNITSKANVSYANHKLVVTIDPDYLASQSLEGQDMILTFKAQITSFPKSETVINKAHVQPGIYGADTETVETQVLGGKIELGKTVDFEHAVGDQASFTITVSSVGPGPARDIVVVDDTLPAGMEIVSGSASISGGGSVQASGRKIEARIAELATGKSAKITFKVTCPESFNGKEVFNTATASFSNPAPDADNPVKASDGLWINSAKLDILKRADTFEYRVGDTVSYTISITNTAPAGTIARGVHLDDTDLPGHIHIDPASIAVQGVPAKVTYNIDGNGKHGDESRANEATVTTISNGFTLDIPYLPAGKLVTVTYTAEATRDSNGAESFNSAVATLANPLPGCESAQSQDGVWTNDAVLYLSKDVDEYETQVGDTVHYTVTCTNLASGTVGKQVVLDDITLPPGLALQADSVKVEGVPERIIYPLDGEGVHDQEERANATEISVRGNSFIVKIDYLPAGAELVITYDCIPTEEVNGDEIINIAKVCCDNMLDNVGAQDDALIWVNTPHLSIEKRVEQRNSYQVGDTVSYLVAVGNTQIGTYARNIIIDDAFALPGMQLIRASVALFDHEDNLLEGAQVQQKRSSADWSMTTNRSLVCPAGNYFRWEEQERVGQDVYNPLGETHEQALYVECQAVISDADLAGQILQNTASVQADNADRVLDDADILVDPRQNGNLVTTHKSSNPAPGSKVAPGDVIAYTLDVANTGTEMAPFTLVRDYIPDGTSYVEGSVSEGGVFIAADSQGNVSGRAYVEWLVCNIAPNASTAVSFSVVVAEQAPALIHNVACTDSIDREVTPGDPTNPEPSEPSNHIYHPTGESPAPAYIDVVKSSNPLPGMVKRGDKVSYTLTVINSGGQEARDIAVYDAIPEYTQYYSHENVHNATLSKSSRALGWNIAQLAAGESVELSFVVCVVESAPDSAHIDNQASWEWFRPGIPDAPLNNTTNITRHIVEPKPSSPSDDSPKTPEEPKDPPLTTTDPKDPSGQDDPKQPSGDDSTAKNPKQSKDPTPGQGTPQGQTTTRSSNGGQPAKSSGVVIGNLAAKTGYALSRIGLVVLLAGLIATVARAYGGHRMRREFVDRLLGRWL